VGKEEGMKVLIANPAFRRDLGGELERYMLGSGMRYPFSLLKRKQDRPRYAMFPLFMAYAAAVAENARFDVKVIDAVPLNMGEAEFIERVGQLNPDVILVEPNAAVIGDTLRLLGRLREVIPAKLVLAGSHATTTTEVLLKENPVVDHVVAGEYELAFTELLRALREHRSLDGIKGLAYREGGRVRCNGRTDPIEPLDVLPLPARHLFPSYFYSDMSVYQDGFCQYSPAFHMHTSRGCPFRCNFCDRVQVLFASNKQRLFSPARVGDEMEALVAAGAGEIYLDDDNFTANREHVAAVCAELVGRRFKAPWSAMCDAMSLDPELLETMAQAGCIGIKFGLDSADAGVLTAIRKPLKLVVLESIVAKAKALGIKTHMSVVLGLTTETKESLHKTFAYSCEVDVDSIQFSLATPLPGTAMYADLVAQQGLSRRDWADLDGANRTVITYPDMSRDYLQAFMADSHTHWLRAKFRKPRWVARQFRFLTRTVRSQGWPGLVRRYKRAVQLLAGDMRYVKEDGQVKVMRY
jgi:anaerobic magnesium-protoporphyrin IX monomethyl ester cyclase